VSFCASPCAVAMTTKSRLLQRRLGSKVVRGALAV
jgi:hypothetical protein